LNLQQSKLSQLTHALSDLLKGIRFNTPALIAQASFKTLINSASINRG